MNRDIVQKQGYTWYKLWQISRVLYGWSTHALSGQYNCHTLDNYQSLSHYVTTKPSIQKHAAEIMNFWLHQGLHRLLH